MPTSNGTFAKETEFNAFGSDGQCDVLDVHSKTHLADAKASLRFNSLIISSSKTMTIGSSIMIQCHKAGVGVVRKAQDENMVYSYQLRQEKFGVMSSAVAPALFTKESPRGFSWWWVVVPLVLIAIVGGVVVFVLRQKAHKQRKDSLMEYNPLDDHI